MKICFVIGTLSYSGAEKIMYHLIRSFEDTKDDISVILLSSETPCANLPGVHQIPLYDKEMEDSHNKITRTLLRQHAIRKVIKQGKYDIIVSFGVIFNIDVLEACRFMGARIIVCERNDPFNDPHNKLLRLRRYIDYPSATKFVFQTRDIRDYFSRYIQKRSVIIPNFIEKKVTPSDYYSPNRKAFATSARLDNRQKDQITLIRAFSLFHKKHPDYCLEFYGNGPDEGLLRSETARLGMDNSVIFKGRVDSPMTHIRTSTAFILSSVYEGMPNALIEAMAYGMPCIASNCSGGGAKALIEHGINGLLYEVGSVTSLEKAMEYIVTNSEVAKTMGNNALKVNEDLNMGKIIPLWRKIIYETYYEKSIVNK